MVYHLRIHHRAALAARAAGQAAGAGLGAEPRTEPQAFFVLGPNGMRLGALINIAEYLAIGANAGTLIIAGNREGWLMLP